MKSALKILKLTKMTEILILDDDVDPLICKENPYISTQRYS